MAAGLRAAGIAAGDAARDLAADLILQFGVPTPDGKRLTAYPRRRRG